jgi:heme oxygenase
MMKCQRQDYVQTDAVIGAMNLGRADVSGLVYPTQRRRNDPLSLLLRRSCAIEHQALKETIGQPGTIITVDAYGEILLMFRVLHSAFDIFRETYADRFRHHEVPREHSELLNLIDRDLKGLGIHVLTTQTLPLAIDHDMGFPRALGTFYVVTGCALGNALLLRQVRSSFGTDLTGVNAFLSANANEAGQTFQALRLRLDNFGATMPETGDAIVEWARHAFTACAIFFGKSANA